MTAARPVRRVTEERDGDADDRDEAASTRDLAAQDRDDQANARDRAAYGRDGTGHERDMTILDHLRAESTRSTALGARAAEIAARVPDGTSAEAEVHWLRQELARVRQDADEMMKAAAADREAAQVLLDDAWQDRRTAAADRRAAELDRQSAARDRRDAAADRAAGAADRQQAEVERAEATGPGPGPVRR